MRRNVSEPGLLAIGISLSLALSACGQDGNASSDSQTSAPTPGQVTAAPPTPTTDSYVWMKPTAGRHAFLGDDGGGASTATVCDTADDYRDWVKSVSDSGCSHHYSRGIPIVIDQVIVDPAKDTAGDTVMPLVKIHASDSSWGGYTELMGLHPLIPNGTVVHFKRTGNDTLRLAASQDTDDGPDLGDSVSARLVKYDPTTPDRDVYVTVLDGQYAGKSGWMYTLEAVTANGDPLGTFSQSAYSAAPEPSVDPNSKTYVIHKDIRAFSDISVCEDAMNAMSDDGAYHRLQDAVAAGDYVDFAEGTHLHVVDDPQPDSPFLIAADDQGNQGCVGRYELPGYGQ